MAKGVKSSTGKIEFTHEFIDQKIDAMRTEILENHQREKEASIDKRENEHLRDYKDLFNNGK